MMDQLLRLDVAGDILKLIRIGRCLQNYGSVHGGSLVVQHDITIPTWEINPPPTTLSHRTSYFYSRPPHTAGHDGKERKSRQKAPPGQ